MVSCFNTNACKKKRDMYLKRTEPARLIARSVSSDDSQSALRMRHSTQTAGISSTISKSMFLQNAFRWGPGLYRLCKL